MYIRRILPAITVTHFKEIFAGYNLQEMLSSTAMCGVLVSLEELQRQFELTRHQSRHGLG